MEEHRPFLAVIEPLFRAADDGKRELATAAFTLLAVLVVPFRAGDLAIAERCEIC
jgi:hypothetical protein